MRTGLSSIVCNYRTAGDLRDFIDSYEAHSPDVDHELTVINVAPGHADRLVAQSHTGRYIEFPDNVGYARACNRAAREAKGDVLAFFNADVRLTPSALETCYQALVSNDRWAILGPRQVDDDGRFTHAGIFGTDDRPKHRAWLEPDRGQHDDVREAVTVSGAAYFVKRHVWDALTACPTFQDVCAAEGAFLPTSHYWNETFASYHARAHGWAVVYFGPVRIVHRWHRASPVGGQVDQSSGPDQLLFRQACDAHGIAHD